MIDANVLNSEIKALLMLMLLKSGTRAEEIQTALQMAAVSRLMGTEENTASAPQAPSPVPADIGARMPPVSEPFPKPNSFARVDAHFAEAAEAVRTQTFAHANRPTLSPKQIYRNEYLAPIKGYAA